MIILACSLQLIPCAKAQDSVAEGLQVADSLFEAGKYTESFKLYDLLLVQEKKTSPGMLLKMAYIKEGLGNYTLALYYLNLYYLQTADKKVLDKMEALAGQHDLQGYTYDDLEFIKTVFYKYFNLIVYVLMALAGLVFMLMLYQKMKYKERPFAAGIGLVLLLSLLFYTINFGKDYNRAIIKEANTFLMDGPSAGAEIIAVVEKGHRVAVITHKDVWAKITWNGSAAYVKTDKLTPIQ